MFLFISVTLTYNTVLSPESKIHSQREKKKSLALSTVARIANRSTESFLTVPTKKRDEKRNPEVQRRVKGTTRDSVVEPVVEQARVAQKKEKKRNLQRSSCLFGFAGGLKSDERKGGREGRAFKTVEDEVA